MMQCHLPHQVEAQQKVIANIVRNMLVGMFFDVAARAAKYFSLSHTSVGQGMDRAGSGCIKACSLSASPRSSGAGCSFKRAAFGYGIAVVHDDTVFHHGVIRHPVGQRNLLSMSFIRCPSRRAEVELAVFLCRHERIE
jgi:hypothetical protein